MYSLFPCFIYPCFIGLLRTERINKTMNELFQILSRLKLVQCQDSLSHSMYLSKNDKEPSIKDSLDQLQDSLNDLARTLDNAR